MASKVDQPKLNAFPVFMRVEGRAVVIVGGGEEAFAKARLLAQSSARMTVVAQAFQPSFLRWAVRADVALVDARFSPEHIAGAALVFAATGEEAADREVVDAARAAGVPVNAVDRPELCDFYTPALVNRAPVAVAIGTEGAGPVLAQKIRVQIERLLSPSLGLLASLAASYRATVETLVEQGAPRRGFWNAFFSGEAARRTEAGDTEGARRAVEGLLLHPERVEGHVALVGAGPGAEDMITLRAHRLLMEADVIVHDALVPDAVIALGRRDAERIAAGKRKGCKVKSQDEINDLLVALARAGERVVRLKSGDPLVFGRAGEEMAALRDAGISYEIVPGVTAAFAAAADFELPLTLRGVASSMVFTTGHDLKGKTLPDWARLAIDGATVAVYMGRSNAAEVAGRLIEAGLSPDTGVAVVENAGQPGRRLLHGTLADLPSLGQRYELTGPVMTIIGDTVGGARFDHSTPLATTRKVPAAGAEGMKILTANRLIDGEVVWLARDLSWAEGIHVADIARDPDAEARLEAIGAQAMRDNQVVDANLVDVELVSGAIVPLRLRERIRAAGPTNRRDLGKQARADVARAASPAT